MESIYNDRIINIIHNGIKKGIRVTFENQCFRSTLILIYSGIDAMAYLNTPKESNRVTRRDFINWVDTYLEFPHNSPISGNDLYGARCGMVHTYTIDSNMSRNDECKPFGYIAYGIPEIETIPYLKVSIEWLKDAFLKAIDTFMMDVFTDTKNPKRRESFEKHLEAVWKIQ